MEIDWFEREISYMSDEELGSYAEAIELSVDEEYNTINKKGNKKMETVTFYTTHCPKCKVIEMKLKQKHIDYIENDNVEEMKSLGITSAPYLKIGDKFYDFANAVKWINEVK